MSNLQKLRLDCVTKEDIPADFSGLHTLTELSMGMPDASPAHMAFISKFPALLTLTLECWLRFKLPSAFMKAIMPDSVPNFDFLWSSLLKLSSIRQLKLLGLEYGNEMFVSLAQMQQLTAVTLSLRRSEFCAGRDHDLSRFAALCHVKRLTVTEYDDHELGELYKTKQAPLYVALQRRFPAQLLIDLQVVLPHTRVDTLGTLDQQLETRLVRSKVAVAPAHVDDRSSDVRFYPLHS